VEPELDKGRFTSVAEAALQKFKVHGESADASSLGYWVRGHKVKSNTLYILRR